MLLNHSLRLSHLLRPEAEVHGALNAGFNPEFRLAVSVLNVDVGPTLLTSRNEPEPLTRRTVGLTRPA